MRVSPRGKADSAPAVSPRGKGRADAPAAPKVYATPPELQEAGYTPPADLAAELDKQLLRLVAAAKANDGEDGWQFATRTKHGVSISYRSEEEKDTKLDCFRGVCISPFTPAELAEEIMKEGLREWDPQLKTSTRLRNIDDHTFVHQNVYQAKKCMIEVHRDFLLVTHKRVLPDGQVCLLSLSRLVDQTERAPPDGCVRGMVYLAGFCLQPWVGDRGANYSNVTYVAHIDLKQLPQKVLEMALQQQPEVISRLTAYLEKNAKK